MGRRLAFTKKVSLAGIAPGWDDCFINVTEASSAERSEVQDFAKNADVTNVEATEKMVTQVKSHFVSGRVRLLDGADADMTEEDVDALPDRVLYDVWAAVNGYDLDPKDIETAMETGSDQKPATEGPSNVESNSEIS